MDSMPFGSRNLARNLRVSMIAEAEEVAHGVQERVGLVLLASGGLRLSRAAGRVGRD